MKHSLAILLLCVAVANAETIYVSQSGSGSGTGVDVSNRMSLANLNTASNWGAGPGKVSPGDTVSLSGIFTSQLIIQGSGTAGNVITILFETGCEFAKPIWGDGSPGDLNGAAIFLSAKHFITIDGGTNGTIRATANGPGLAFSGESIAVEAQSECQNLTVRNLIIKDMYDRPKFSTDQERRGAGVHLNNAGTNALIENCDISDGDFCVGGGYAGTLTGLVIRNNYLHRSNHCISFGTYVNNSRLVNPKVHDNIFDEFSYWTATPGLGDLHMDGIIMIHESPTKSEVVDGMEIYNNRFGPDAGGPPLGPDEAVHNTAAIFIDTYIASQFINAKIYNNLFLLNPGDSGWTNGFISTGGALIANNTFVGSGTGVQMGDNTTITNNVFNLSSGNAVILGQTRTNILLDYNVYNPNVQFADNTRPPPAGGIYGNLTQWKADGYDPHSTSGIPTLDANYVPTAADTLARDQGISLASSFTTDKRGVIRPQQTAWDKGAMEFAPGGGDPFPTISTVTIPAAGTTANVLFSEPIKTLTGGAGGWTLTMNGGAVTMTMPPVPTLTNTVTCTLNRTIGASETGTVAYAQPGNGIEDSAGQDLGSVSGFAVFNNSTQQQAATPTFSPVPGAYSSTQNVTMSSTTSGSTVRYTTNGTDPTASSTPWTAPVPTSLSTTYKARAFASGFISSPVATGAYQIGDFIITLNTWSNAAIATQTGTFTWTFRATSASSPNDAVMALADHTVTGYPDMAVIARFGPGGVVDAFNGTTGGYAAVNSFPYTAGQAYDFAVTVNVPAHTFSMTVVQAGGSTPTTIATNYAFRSTQSGVVDLDVFSGYSSLSTVTVSNMVFAPIGTGISRTGMSTNTAGTQLTVNFNTQPSFGTGGQGGFTVSASGGAVTASNPVIGSNAITWQTLSRVIGRGETLSATYAQPGNGIEAASGGADLANFAGQTVVNNSTVDLTPPTPNPSTFSIAPTVISSTAITMTATISTDAFSGPVSYFFNETSGNAGGSDSGWQTGAGANTFTDTGLAAGTQYTYRVQVRDSAPTPNVTTFSSSASATTRSVAGARPARPFNTARASIVTP